MVGVATEVSKSQSVGRDMLECLLLESISFRAENHFLYISSSDNLYFQCFQFLMFLKSVGGGRKEKGVRWLGYKKRFRLNNPQDWTRRSENEIFDTHFVRRIIFCIYHGIIPPLTLIFMLFCQFSIFLKSGQG